MNSKYWRVLVVLFLVTIAGFKSYALSHFQIPTDRLDTIKSESYNIGNRKLMIIDNSDEEIAPKDFYKIREKIEPYESDDTFFTVDLAKYTGYGVCRLVETPFDIVIKVCVFNSRASLHLAYAAICSSKNSSIFTPNKIASITESYPQKQKEREKLYKFFINPMSKNPLPNIITKENFSNWLDNEIRNTKHQGIIKYFNDIKKIPVAEYFKGKS
jgi:hypothetical protein